MSGLSPKDPDTMKASVASSQILKVKFGDSIGYLNPNFVRSVGDNTLGCRDIDSLPIKTSMEDEGFLKIFVLILKLELTSISAAGLLS